MKTQAEGTAVLGSPLAMTVAVCSLSAMTSKTGILPQETANSVEKRAVCRSQALSLAAPGLQNEVE